jgi:hypothetical protein
MDSAGVAGLPPLDGSRRALAAVTAWAQAANSNTVKMSLANFISLETTMLGER